MSINHRAEAAVRAVLGAISGVHVAAIRIPRTGPGRVAVDIDLTGWSPSLHAHVMTWKGAARTGLDPDIVANDLVESCSIEIGLQTRRLEQALDLRRATPFPIAGADTSVGHVLVDRGLLALMSAGESRPLRAVVAESIANIHGDGGGGKSDRLDCDDWIVGRAWHRMERVAERTLFDGTCLWMGGVDLSETTKAQCVGRRLGEIATVPDCIADRVVTEARAADDAEGGTELHVAPIHVAIAEFERGR